MVALASTAYSLLWIGERGARGRARFSARTGFGPVLPRGRPGRGRRGRRRGVAVGGVAARHLGRQRIVLVDVGRVLLERAPRFLAAGGELERVRAAVLGNRPAPLVVGREMVLGGVERRDRAVR